MATKPTLSNGGFIAGAVIQITLDFIGREVVFVVDGKMAGKFTNLNISQPLGLTVLLPSPGAKVELLEVP